MLLKVKKQIDETLEVKTPAYYREHFGAICYINEAGILVTVYSTLIAIYNPSQADHYTKQLADLVTKGKPCTRVEFDTAYRAALENIQAAVDGVVINS